MNELDIRELWLSFEIKLFSLTTISMWKHVEDNSSALKHIVSECVSSSIWVSKVDRDNSDIIDIEQSKTVIIFSEVKKYFKYNSNEFDDDKTRFVFSIVRTAQR